MKKLIFKFLMLLIFFAWYKCFGMERFSENSRFGDDLIGYGDDSNKMFKINENCIVIYKVKFFGDYIDDDLNFPAKEVSKLFRKSKIKYNRQQYNRFLEMGGKEKSEKLMKDASLRKAQLYKVFSQQFKRRTTKTVKGYVDQNGTGICKVCEYGNTSYLVSLDGVGIELDQTGIEYYFKILKRAYSQQ